MNTIIGIDPGQKTGIALVIDGKLVKLDTVDFWRAYRVVDSYKGIAIRVAVEVPRNKKNWHGVGAAVAVGGVIREAQLLAEGIERLGFIVDRVHPTGIGKKMKHAEFCKLTGWVGRTNEHTRDAALLALGVR